jgi:hypothetical protein
MSFPNPPDRGFAQALHFGHESGAPMGGMSWLGVQSSIQHRAGLVMPLIAQEEQHLQFARDISLYRRRACSVLRLFSTYLFDHRCGDGFRAIKRRQPSSVGCSPF